jgi:hypothetical protein
MELSDPSLGLKNQELRSVFPFLPEMALNRPKALSSVPERLSTGNNAAVEKKTVRGGIPGGIQQQLPHLVGSMVGWME